MVGPEVITSAVQEVLQIYYKYEWTRHGEIQLTPQIVTFSYCNSSFHVSLFSSKSPTEFWQNGTRHCPPDSQFFYLFKANANWLLLKLRSIFSPNTIQVIAIMYLECNQPNSCININVISSSFFFLRFLNKPAFIHFFWHYFLRGTLKAIKVAKKGHF